MIGKWLNRLRRIRLPKPTPVPELTPRMKAHGLVWARIPGKFIPVCDFCGGNCGQCGITSIVGNVGFSMKRMAEKSGLFDKPIPTYRSLSRSLDRLEKKINNLKW
jgi:hypothetical protein